MDRLALRHELHIRVDIFECRFEIRLQAEIETQKWRNLRDLIAIGLFRFRNRQSFFTLIKIQELNSRLAPNPDRTKHASSAAARARARPRGRSREP